MFPSSYPSLVPLSLPLQRFDLSEIEGVHVARHGTDASELFLDPAVDTEQMIPNSGPITLRGVRLRYDAGHDP
jgi:hypothetical protein